jgi:hypothetical protein
MSAPPIDLGCDHSMTWAGRHGGDPGEHVGVIVSHPLRPGDQVCAWRGRCSGWVEFDIPANAADTGAKWQVVSENPLTLSPSLLCHCGDHGWIQEGRWVAAG